MAGDRFGIALPIIVFALGIGVIGMARRRKGYADDPAVQRAAYVVVGVVMMVGSVALLANWVREQPW